MEASGVGTLTCHSITIRLVETDLGDRAAQYYGLEKAPVTLEASVRRIIAQIDAAEKSTTSGPFVDITGSKMSPIRDINSQTPRYKSAVARGGELGDKPFSFNRMGRLRIYGFVSSIWAYNLHHHFYD
ncbi:hypothetical protein ASPVEDRAFT_28828 [Aspergillus versicolor CBS 583.65]|uniref:Uncharacterized protein n=1 Tax=Aspergillus versicolor CBS 583.65 TaxID=1036611 RepID=A0A1L9PLB2_ASPVE|nr:uncharacterized protein ASPVEDRAFT_28828 [Aspergillus versicolor CBS 583.65]OJJ02225.1 hypothetical protein ASPVEDRAFT_28828 [Aspergillus versicolor CBS 583.65]